VPAAAAWTESGPHMARVTRPAGWLPRRRTSDFCRDLTGGPPAADWINTGQRRWHRAARQSQLHPNLMGQVHCSRALARPRVPRFATIPLDAGSGGRIRRSGARSRLGLRRHESRPRSSAHGEWRHRPARDQRHHLGHRRARGRAPGPGAGGSTWSSSGPMRPWRRASPTPAVRRASPSSAPRRWPPRSSGARPTPSR